MEKSKYYTPELEEFHVGFEYEIEDLGDDGRTRVWRPQIFEGEETRTYFIEELRKGEIRVKYTDREDIESLGWEFHQQNHSGCLSSFWNKKDVLLRLTVSYKNSIPYVSIYHCEGWETPEMIIKNKSELKRILKQLNV